MCNAFGSNGFKEGDNEWDLETDCSVVTAETSLFQMKFTKEYGDCELQGTKCPHLDAYLNEPGIRGCGEISRSFIYAEKLHLYDDYLQKYFDCEYNNFGLMASVNLDKTQNGVAREQCGVVEYSIEWEKTWLRRAKEEEHTDMSPKSTHASASWRLPCEPMRVLVH